MTNLESYMQKIVPKFRSEDTEGSLGLIPFNGGKFRQRFAMRS